MRMPLPFPRPLRARRTPAGLFFTTLALIAILALAACSSTAASGGTARANGSAPNANSGSGSSVVSAHGPAATPEGTRAPSTPSSPPGAAAPTPVPTRAGPPSTQPTPIPTRPPAPGPFPTATPFPPDYCAPYLNNPWGFNFNCGSTPVLLGEVGMPSAPQFCAFFKATSAPCNPNFGVYNGFVFQCLLDNTFMRSDGFKSDTNTCPHGGTRRGLLVYHPPTP